MMSSKTKGRRATAPPADPLIVRDGNVYVSIEGVNQTLDRRLGADRRFQCDSAKVETAPECMPRLNVLLSVKFV